MEGLIDFLAHSTRHFRDRVEFAYFITQVVKDLVLMIGLSEKPPVDPITKAAAKCETDRSECGQYEKYGLLEEEVSEELAERPIFWPQVTLLPTATVRLPCIMCA